MRKLIFFSFLFVGAGFGFLWGPPDDWLTRLLMMGISMIFAGAIGGRQRISVEVRRSLMPMIGTRSIGQRDLAFMRMTTRPTIGEISGTLLFQTRRTLSTSLQSGPTFHISGSRIIF
ncbi:hypothetical protein DYL61_13405 [Pseudomonas nabeulensis]|uniref:Uncharacterized protein n=1 Tax=Pseudomonas nabeulensis TaxID=2293833 RepID=A0A4Z0B4Y9_9PSED|nr:hypothetical protein DYL61_13405 [Pseudomonas nabeulensis]